MGNHGHPYIHIIAALCDAGFLSYFNNIPSAQNGEILCCPQSISTMVVFNFHSTHIQKKCFVHRCIHFQTSNHTRCTILATMEIAISIKCHCSLVSGRTIYILISRTKVIPFDCKTYQSTILLGNCKLT